MNRHHRLTDTELDALARGLGGPEVVRSLRAGQISKRMLLLRTLLDAVSPNQLGNHYELLTEAARRRPDVATAALSAPHTGAWLASVLRQVRGSWPAPYRPVDEQLRYLGGLAAAAAIHAGLDFKTEVEPTGGEVVLPGLGRATVGEAATVTITHVAGEAWVGPVRVPADPTGDGDGWHGLRRLTATCDGLSLAVQLDDLDPYRDCHRLSAADRLDPAAVSSWQRLLGEAWQILVRHHRPYAEAIAEGLITVVPLRIERVDQGVNVTSMDAFGAMSLTTPPDGAALALGLLHEFQHAKLGALLDLVPLYHRDDPTLYYAPWRDDPRPIGATLQGVYAFLGVTDFWRVRRQVLTGDSARTAETEFVLWRDRVSRTLDDLSASRYFTPVGRRFLAGLRAVLDRWHDEPVAGDTIAAADATAEEHRVASRLRNRHPEPAAVSTSPSVSAGASPPR